MKISQYISNEKVRSRVGMPVALADMNMISDRRLCWLGHVATVG